MIQHMIPGDEARLDAFLARHSESSMFLRSNLAAHGLGASEHPHATTYYASHAQSEITGVIGVTRGGFMMVQAPQNPAELAPMLAGHRAIGMTGAADQVDQVLECLRITPDDCTLYDSEPLMTMMIADAPDLGAQVRPARESDVAFLPEWMAHLNLDTRLSPDEASARIEGQKRAKTARRDPTFRIMEDGGHPVGMTMLNARVSETVQVGGVFVARDQRCKGYGARMVSSQLHDAARVFGAQRAILIANNPNAERVYARLGFETQGDYRVAIFKQPQELSA